MATVAFRAHSRDLVARCAEEEKEFPEQPWRGSCICLGGTGTLTFTAAPHNFRTFNSWW